MKPIVKLSKKQLKTYSKAWDNYVRQRNIIEFGTNDKRKIAKIIGECFLANFKADKKLPLNGLTKLRKK